MSEQRTQRRIVAILATDAVGYSRLMNEHEERTLKNFHTCQRIFHHAISHYGGRVFGSAGDSFLAEFPSAVEALRCAVEIQQRLAQRNAKVTDADAMQFRIGIHVGDVMVVGDNLAGDGINISARLEGLADPGGINISGHVYDQVRNKIEVGFHDLGKQALKNIPEPVLIYKVIFDPVSIAHPSQALTLAPTVSSRRAYVLAFAAIALVVITVIGFIFTPSGGYETKISAAQQHASNPSILVLPFTNKSADRDQDYFVDGISEDLITDFSRLSNLTVIAWHTAASYKGKTLQAQALGKELGVGYILEGSVRKSGDQLRITAELVDASNGKQLWAERYDRKAADVFALQDEVTKKIVQALAVKLTVSENGQQGSSATRNIAAYETFLRAQKYASQLTGEGDELARETYQRAIELDPTYARAYSGMAFSLAQSFFRSRTDTPVENLDRALVLAEKGVTLGYDIPQTHWALGYVYLMRREYENAEKAVTKAISIAPNYADGFALLALINNALGKPKEAIELINKAMLLNPFYSYDYPYNLGRAYYTLGRYKLAVELLENAHARNENALSVNLVLAASYVGAGRVADAEWIIDLIKIQNPEATLSKVEKTFAISKPSLRKAFLGDLRKAGLTD